MSIRIAARLAWSICGLSVALMLGGLLMLIAARSASLPPSFELGWGGAVITLVIDLLVPLIGGLIAAHRPENPYGWVWCAGGLGFALAHFAEGYALYTLLVNPGSLPHGAAAAWVIVWAWPLTEMLLPFFFLLFPTGHLPSHRWRVVAGAAIAIGVVVPLVSALKPGPLWSFPSIENPWGVRGAAAALYPGVDPITWIIFVGILLVSVVSVFLRFRSARGVESQQLKWFTYAAVFLISFLVVDLFFQDILGVWGELLFFICLAGLYVAMGIAVLRYRLYDIDVIIRRSLIYGVLTGALALVYFGSVVLLQGLFRTLTGHAAQSQLAMVVSTLAIAALFTPLRRRVQDVIDRRFYRRKYDAAKTLAAFSATVRDETDLDKLTEALVAVVEETMQPAHVALWLKPTADGRPQK